MTYSNVRVDAALTSSTPVEAKRDHTPHSKVGRLADRQ